METDAAVGQPHEIGHRCALEASPPRNGVDFGCGIPNDQITLAVIDLSVAVRTLLRDLFGDLEFPHRRRGRAHTGSYPSPADFVRSGVEKGLLLVEIDLDMGDFMPISLPLIEYRLRLR